MPSGPSNEAQLCTMCGVVKPIAEFHRRGGRRQKWCKSCRKTWDSAYHARTKPLRLRQKRERRLHLVAWMRELKTSQPCVDCGGWFHPAAMTFDHLPGQKKVGDVAVLVQRGCTGLARLEVLKCDVVCANCHAVRTFMRREAESAARKADRAATATR